MKRLLIAAAALSLSATNALPQDAMASFRAGQAAAAARMAMSEAIDPANWECARPIIQRNFNRDIAADQLALRIADECTRPYVARPIRSDIDQTFESQDRLTYTYRQQTFVLEIEARIQQARRLAALKLD